MDFDQIAVANRLFGDLDLQCISKVSSSESDVVWLSQELDQELVMLQEDGDDAQQEDEYISVSYDSNSANLTLRNFIKPYRGTLKCSSAAFDRSITIFITESKESNS